MKTEVDVLKDILLLTPGLGARIWIYLNIMSKLLMKHISEVFMAKADKWIFRLFFFFLIRKKMTSVFPLKSFPWVFSLRFIFIGLLATVTSLYFETALIFFYSRFFCFECERSHDLPQRILVTIIFPFRFSQMSPVIVKYWTRRLNVPIKNVRGSENSEMSR